MNLKDKFPEVFWLQDAYEAGIPRGQIHTKQLKRIYREIYAHRDKELTDLELLQAICHSLKGAVLTSLSAAKLWEMRLPHRFQQDNKIYLMTGKRHQRIERPNIISTQASYSSDEVTSLHGISITTPERTFLELGKLLTPTELIYVADGILCQHPYKQKVPLLEREKLEDYLLSKRRVRGVRRCRWALENAVDGSDSWKETELRLLLTEYGVRGLETNRPIFDESGFVLVEPDLADLKHCLSIQYEGAHHAERAQLLRDRRRKERTELAGWTEVRIFAEDLREFVWWEGEMVPRAVAMVLQARKLR